MERKTRRPLSCVLAFLLTLTLSAPAFSAQAAAAPAPKNNATVVNTGKTPLYKTASTASKKLATLKKGANVAVVTYSPKLTFSKVTSSKQTGYVNNLYLRVKLAALGRDGVQTIKANAKTTAKGVVYAAPNAKALKLQTLKKGAAVKVLNSTFNAKFAQVNSGGYVGYIARANVKLNKGVPTGVVPILVGSVAVTPKTKALNAGQTVQLKAVVKPDGAKNKAVTWKTSDAKVATVNAKGKVTAIAAGTAKITATAKDGSKKAGSATITVAETAAKQLTIADPTVTKTKAYDGKVNAVVTPGKLVEDIGTDDVKVAAAAVYENADAGTAKKLTVSYTLSGTDAAKYIAPVAKTYTDGVIEKANATVSADGKQTIPSAVKGAEIGDKVTLTVSGVNNETFVGKWIGTAPNANGAKATVTFAATGGTAKAANYKAITAEITVTEVLTQLTITGTEVEDTKNYDGTVDASMLTIGLLEGMESGDDVAIDTVAAEYDTADAGDEKSITVEYTIAGADAAKYVAPAADEFVGTIAKAQASVSGAATIAVAVYGDEIGDQIADGDFVVGGVNSETFVGTWSCMAKQQGSGNEAAFTPTGGTANPDNYDDIATTDVTVTLLNAKQLTIATPIVTNKTKIYDGSLAGPNVLKGALSGVLEGDDVYIDTVVADYDDADVGTGKTIEVTYTIAGNDETSYIAPVPSTVGGGVITVATATVSNGGIETIASATSGAEIGDQVTLAVEGAAGETFTGTWACTAPSASGETAIATFTPTGGTANAANYASPITAIITVTTIS